LSSLLSTYHLSPTYALLAGGILSWSLLLILIPILRRKLLDRPTSRSAHLVPIPRGGGVSFVVVGSLLAPISGNTPLSLIPIYSVPLAIVGILDDRFGISVAFRFVAQLLTGVILIHLVSLPVPFWGSLLALVVITAIINFINFMDGIDGLVGTCCALLLATAALEPLLPSQSQIEPSSDYLWPLIGAIIGFLFWNWSPARVFMGDVGSTFLGAVVAGSIIQQSTLASATGLLFVGFPLFADALTCVLRRLSCGQPIFQAHKLHLFQRLHQSGWTHSQVTILYGSATALLAGAHLSGNIWLFVFVLSLELITGFWLNKYVALPFASNNASSSNPKL